MSSVRTAHRTFKCVIRVSPLLRIGYTAVLIGECFSFKFHYLVRLLAAGPLTCAQRPANSDTILSRLAAAIFQALLRICVNMVHLDVKVAATVSFMVAKAQMTRQVLAMPREQQRIRASGN